MFGSHGILADGVGPIRVISQRIIMDSPGGEKVYTVPYGTIEFFSGVDLCVDEIPGGLIMAACQRNPENASPGCARRLPSGPSRRSSRATSPGSPGTTS